MPEQQDMCTFTGVTDSLTQLARCSLLALTHQKEKKLSDLMDKHAFLQKLRVLEITEAAQAQHPTMPFLLHHCSHQTNTQTPNACTKTEITKIPLY